MKNNESVMVLSNCPYEKINGVLGTWDYCKYKNNYGWVFSGYLSRPVLFDPSQAITKHIGSSINEITIKFGQPSTIGSKRYQVREHYMTSYMFKWTGIDVGVAIFEATGKQIVYYCKINMTAPQHIYPYFDIGMSITNIGRHPSIQFSKTNNVIKYFQGFMINSYLYDQDKITNFTFSVMID